MKLRNGIPFCRSSEADGSLHARSKSLAKIFLIMLDRFTNIFLCILLSHFAPSIDLFSKKLIDNVGPSQGKCCFSNSQIWSINYPLKKIPSIFFQLMINESFGWNSFVFYKRAILGLFLVYFRFISNKVCGAGIWTHNLLNASLLP